jgi:hypothetical protein
MTHPPQPWFSSLVAIEVLLQLPFFVLAAYVIFQKNGKNNILRDNGIFQSLCMIYGSSTATTLIPIFASIATDPDTTFGEKGILLCFYLPYMIFPLWLLVISFCEVNVLGLKSNKRN